jgi:hypothetical protein
LAFTAANLGGYRMALTDRLIVQGQKNFPEVLINATRGRIKAA